MCANKVMTVCLRESCDRRLVARCLLGSEVNPDAREPSVETKISVFQQVNEFVNSKVWIITFLWLLLLGKSLREAFGVTVLTSLKQETVRLLRRQDLMETRFTLSVCE